MKNTEYKKPVFCSGRWHLFLYRETKSLPEVGPRLQNGWVCHKRCESWHYFLNESLAQKYHLVCGERAVGWRFWNDRKATTAIYCIYLWLCRAILRGSYVLTFFVIPSLQSSTGVIGYEWEQRSGIRGTKSYSLAGCGQGNRNNSSDKEGEIFWHEGFKPTGTVKLLQDK